MVRSGLLNSTILRISPQDDEGLDGLAGDRGDGDSVLLWVPTGRRLLSGLLGLNVVLLGAALVAGDAFHPAGLRHQEPEMFLLLLLGLSVLWMMWFLLWARRQPGSPPHTDHLAGSVTVTVVLILFAGFSLLLCVFGMVYNLLMKACRPSAKVLLPFMQTPFLALQAYLLWFHSKDCIHKHRVLTRSGLMVILCTNILLWLNAVTEDSVHMEIELERQYENPVIRKETDQDTDNDTACLCSRQPACAALRRGYEMEKRAEHVRDVDLAGEELLHRSSKTPAPPTGRFRYSIHAWSRRLIQEICAFLILSNVLLWVIPAFGAHPQFESGVGREFYGFSVWFVLVNLGQPLIVFYRMHSVGALMELLISA
ncbi:proton channel OTOP3-like isoform X2 [Brachyhypopomus gauderio]|uniref:proton channel OTOP3-like isoform X2 n=1 Tax=Brachyhypopomus gauderio TaxID=698409 RepID=UPI0040426B05